MMRPVKNSRTPFSVMELDCRSKSSYCSQFRFFVITSLISVYIYSHLCSQILISNKLNYSIYAALISLCAVLSFLIPVDRVIRNLTKVPIAQQEQLQTYVNWSGLESINPLLTLLKLSLEKNRQSPLLDQVVINLKILLLQIKPDSKIHLTRDDKEFLMDIVYGETQGKDLKSVDRELKFSQISTILTPSAIYALGKIGGAESLDSLQKRYDKSKSTRIKHLITEAVQNIDPEIVLQMQKSGDTDYDKEASEVELKRGSQGREKRTGKYGWVTWKTGKFSVVLIWVITLFYLIQVYPIRDSVLTIFVFLPILIIPELLIRSRLKKVEKISCFYLSHDDPVALKTALNPSVTLYHSNTFLQRLQLNEVLENSLDHSSETISSQQIGILNNLLYPRKSLLDGLPFINLPLEEVVRLDIVIKALAKYGDSSSLRALRKFTAQTTNESYKLLAEQSFDILQERLLQKPEQLLRPSVIAEGDLLHSVEIKSPLEYLHIPNNVDESVNTSEEIEVVGNKQK